MTRQSELQQRFTEVLGAAAVISDADTMEPYVTDWRGRLKGNAVCVLRPGSTEEVQKAVHICRQEGIAIVPQGGNTGLVGGATPSAAGNQVVISLARMNRVLEVRPDEFTLTTEAGATLLDIQKAASEHGRLFPLSLPAEGTCQIGGNISTNAGGVRVMRYGMTRELVLGLEVVLPSGDIWNGLSNLVKDNSGYNLKHAFIGAEGTLGIITRASLKLYPEPRTKLTTFVAGESVARMMDMLRLVDERAGDLLAAYELVPQIALDMVLRHLPDTRDPIPTAHAFYAVIDFWSPGSEAEVTARAEAVLGEGLERGMIQEAIFAQSVGQAAELWNLREYIAEAQRHEGPSVKHDVSVGRGNMAEFETRASAQLEQFMAGIRPIPFGHVADGNLHYDICGPLDMAAEAYSAEADKISDIVYDIVADLGGSIAAEHGIGTTKRAPLHKRKDDTSLALMRSLKTAFDPDNLLNPGKIV